MRRLVRPPAVVWPALLAWLTVSTAPARADQHTVEAIIAALKLPIAPAAVAQAREADDKIMAGGDIEGVHVYLVTDERSGRVNKLIATLLQAAGQNPSEWVVRVLDTDPQLINAFVMGGKYVYVYTGLLDEKPSDDELAFILSHELGHSLLKHQERQSKDASTTWAGVFGLKEPAHARAHNRRYPFLHSWSPFSLLRRLKF